MYFPMELWKEIKVYAGIHSISTDWSFSHLYEGNWIQFYLEWFQPSAEEVNQIKDTRHIQQEIFTRAFSFKHWQRVHFLNTAHQQLQVIHPVYRCCNALLEIKPHELTEDYDIIEFYIPFSLEEDKELEMIQSIHALLDRCHLTRLFYYYQPGSLILSVHAKPQDKHANIS
jgi:hypothetical protein